MFAKAISIDRCSSVRSLISLEPSQRPPLSRQGDQLQQKLVFLHAAVDDDDPVILILFVEFESFRKRTVTIDRE